MSHTCKCFLIYFIHKLLRQAGNLLTIPKHRLGRSVSKYGTLVYQAHGNKHSSCVLLTLRKIWSFLSLFYTYLFLSFLYYFPIFMDYFKAIFLSILNLLFLKQTIVKNSPDLRNKSLVN